MKTILINLLLFCSVSVFSQKVYLSKDLHDCDGYIQIVQRLGQADYVAHITRNRESAKKNHGNWVLVNTKTEADLKLCIVSQRYDAVKVYFSPFKVRHLESPFKKRL